MEVQRVSILSRRDLTKVAWHEVPGIVAPSESVPEGRYDWWLIRARQIFVASVSSHLEDHRTLYITGVTFDHTVPKGTDRFGCIFQALRARLPSFRPSGTRGRLTPIILFLRTTPRLNCDWQLGDK